MEEKSREQELSVREISLIRELTQIRKEHKRELEYEKFDGYELPPRTQFSMLNKPAVSIKYGVMKFNMACIRLFEGIKYVLPILHPNKKRLAFVFLGARPIFVFCRGKIGSLLRLLRAPLNIPCPLRFQTGC